jgi:hypothetical protein
MARIKKQISLEGTPLKRGLETLISIPVYSGEYLSYGGGFTSATFSGATDYTTSGADPTLYAVTNSVPSTAGEWYLYHTSSATTPTSTDNSLTLSTQADHHCGMYQKLSGLIVGQVYEVTIFIQRGGGAGTFTFEVFNYFPDADNNPAISKTSSEASTTPLAKITTTFTARTSNDIVLFDYISTTGETSVSIYGITIKQKDEYLVPVFETDNWNVGALVLNQTDNTEMTDDEDES